MGKLNIAHHKSYHPYRADNIARVKADEARAKAEAELDNDRKLAADAEARIDALRRRAGIEFTGTSTGTGDSSSTSISAPGAGPFSASTSTTKSISGPKAPTDPTGHINLFADLEAHETSLSARASQKKPALTDSDRGVALAPSKEDLSPWYSSASKRYEDDEGKGGGGRGRRAGWKAREERRKEGADPLAGIPAYIRHPSSASSSPTTSAHSRRPVRPSSFGDDASSLRLARESSERARARALIAKRKAERERADGSSVASATPSTVHGNYGDMYNRAEVEEARRERVWGRRGQGEV
ncbi:unnamed protein product, partial [Peniophora sp. CBMAI 1063]